MDLFKLRYVLTGVNKVLSRRPTFRARGLTCAPNHASKKKWALKTEVHFLDITTNISFRS